ncbi:MAG: DUF2791 family P-loop domain-containing protein [Armatimonadetes bacterium]|nr:DUF2791 family P-loop domain-containing protein [Armatimonadota bacterium]
MTSVEARRAIEALRKGLPPDGHVRRFTVGREAEIGELESRVRQGRAEALLLRANYGAGKSHLLRLIRELAISERYAVSLLSLDARADVRFNRMDQIFGAAIRNIEVPDSAIKGPGALFGALLDAMTSPCPDPSWKSQLDELSNMGRWDYSTALRSPALFVAVRAWIVGTLYDDDHGMVPREVESWICEPWNYYTRTKWLYYRFVSGLRNHFRDPRAAWQFYRRGCETFILRAAGYQQAWDALRDLNVLAQMCGFRGLVLLVDEFEDVIYNLRGGGVDCQYEAFWNLFRLFWGEYPGMSFYAVTPGFSEKCKELLRRKGYRDFDYSHFDELPAFEMSPIGIHELDELALRIMDAHGMAYGWEPDPEIIVSELKEELRQIATIPVQDRARRAITNVVSLLDQRLEATI